MSWRDELQRVTLADGRRLIGASFRGVPFLVDSAGRTGGRRIVTHEFPLRDDPYVEDLGRRARTFPVEGYLVGPDYLEQRDALLEALEDVAGPGRLVHPHHGVRRAICSALSTRETVADGGMVFLSIEFTETPAQSVMPTEEPDSADVVSRDADAALAGTAAELAASYDVAGLPAFALGSATVTLQTLSAKLGAGLGPIVRSTNELARLDVEIRSVTSQAASLVREPDAVLGAFQGMLTAVATTVVSSPAAVVRALIDTYAADAGPLPPLTTATRRREYANQVALEAALRRVAAIEAARLATSVPYATEDEATAARNAIAALLDEQASTAGDEAYPALVQLRADLVRAVPGDSVFARLITVERRVSIPSLLLAFQLYGSVDQEADIVARNLVRHPGFVSGELRVLSDV